MSTTAVQMVVTATARVATVTPQDAWEEIARGDAVVLDVREPIEWEEHIEGAVLRSLGRRPGRERLKKGLLCSK